MPSTILSDNGVSSGTSGIKTTGSNDGALALQTTTAGGTATTAISIDTSQNVTFAGAVTNPAGTAAAPSITFTGDTNTGIFSPAADTIAFTEGGVESMRIDSSGNVGIGTASPAEKLSVVAGNALIDGTSSGGYLEFRASADNSNRARLYCTTNGDFRIATNLSTVAMTITYQQNVKLTSNLSVGNATPTTSGTGITFPATQSASSDANTLDDYEEGTFTPTVIGSTTAGTATYTRQIGRYTKIGNRVLINITLQYSGGNGTGNLRIAGLPFTPEASQEVPMAVYNANIAMTANHVMQIITRQNATELDINSYPSGGGADANVAYDGAGIIMIGGHYNV